MIWFYYFEKFRTWTRRPRSATTPSSPTTVRTAVRGPGRSCRTEFTISETILKEVFDGNWEKYFFYSGSLPRPRLWPSLGRWETPSPR